MAATWSFQLVDRNHVPIGEILNASERRLKSGIRQVDTASFRVRSDNNILLPLFSEDTFLQVWQDKNLRFFGPCLTPEIASNENEEATVAVNAVSPMWRLAHRISGKAAAGVTYSGADKGAIARNLIDVANVVADSGIDTTAGVLLLGESGSTANYIAGPYKPTLTCIRELANGFDGFDWRVTPLAEGGTKLGRFELAATIGEPQPNSVFEYGTGRNNMRAMTYKRDLTNLMNDGFYIPEEGAVKGVIEISDAESLAEHGRFESIVETLNLSDTTLQSNWVRENVEVRKVPRQILTLTSDFIEATGRTPEAWYDYSPGDEVPARVQSGNIVLVNGWVRCYSVEVTVDVFGTPTYIPTLVEEAGESAEEA